MKNRYAFFLNFLCAAIIAIICVIQINSLTENYDVSGHGISMDVYNYFRNNQSITLILAIAAIAVLFSKEGIDLGLKRKAYLDITGIMNKHACLEEMSMLDCNDSTLNIGFAVFDLNNLKKVNDFYGHEEGDKLIQSFVQLLREASDKKYFIGRFGGDEFIVIIQNCSEAIMDSYLGSIRELTENFNKGRSIQLSYACGYAISTKEHYYLTDELLKEADKRMYENKKMMKASNLFEPEQISRILDTDRVNPLEKDDLTGVFEYDKFLSAVNKILHIYNQDARLAIVCSDIYNFRYINDLYGHKEGNMILKRFASDLSSQPFCLCAHRIYSDNFAFLVDISQMSDEESVELIRSWNAHFSGLINKICKGSRLIVKSGIYFISDSNEPVESMLNKADCAHKFTKTAHHNVFVYSDELSQTTRRHSEIINSFQRALEQQEFRVYAQPKILCSDKIICGAEALIRWQRRDGILICPDEFIPVLEKTGDIIEMDFYVYEKVFSYIYENYCAGNHPIPMSVNVSRIHLSKIDEFISRIQALRSTYPIPTRLITFELTESAYIQEIYSANLFIEEVQALGYSVSMDDFGSGYSSLKALQSIPFNEVKFDRAFLSESPGGKKHSILLQMLKLVKSTGVKVVCEGVETIDHVLLLEQSGCDMLQGFHFCRPLPLEDLNKYNNTP